MPQNKYRVFELSARAVMSYATQKNGQWNFALDRTATEKCKCFCRETIFPNPQMTGSLTAYPM